MVNPIVLAASVIILVISVVVLFALIINRRRNKIKTLDYMILIFVTVVLTSISQIAMLLFQDDIWLLQFYKGEGSPLFYNPVRDFSLIGVICFYILAEYLLRERLHSLRVSVIVSSLVVYLLVPIYHHNTGQMIWTNQIIPFANKTRLDEFANDIIWYLSIIMIQYTYYKQYKASINSEYRRNILTIFVGISIFSICYIWEIMEHFLPIIDIDVTIFMLPVFFSFGYVYLTKPNFAYYTPASISFLQIATADGLLIYTADLRINSESKEYLLTMSISSINSLLREIVDPINKRIYLNSINFNKGAIMFEQIGNIILMLHTENPSRILRQSMRYLIHEFTDLYKETIRSSALGVHSEGFKGVEDLIVRCIPTIQSRLFSLNNMTNR